VHPFPGDLGCAPALALGRRPDVSELVAVAVEDLGTGIAFDQDLAVLTVDHGVIPHPHHTTYRQSPMVAASSALKAASSIIMLRRFIG
jgi:hypothetical protein